MRPSAGGGTHTWHHFPPLGQGEGMLNAWVEAGESGPVVMLAGEADLTDAEPLSALISGQLATGTCQLTIDVSGLRYADSASIRTLALAARTLTARGGRLLLLDPQPSVARVLTLLGVDHMVTIRERPGPRQQPKPSGQREDQHQPEHSSAEKAHDEHGID